MIAVIAHKRIGTNGQTKGKIDNTVELGCRISVWAFGRSFQQQLNVCLCSVVELVSVHFDALFIYGRFRLLYFIRFDWFGGFSFRFYSGFFSTFSSSLWLPSSSICHSVCVQSASMFFLLVLSHRPLSCPINGDTRTHKRDQSVYNLHLNMCLYHRKVMRFIDLFQTNKKTQQKHIHSVIDNAISVNAITLSMLPVHQWQN